MRQLGIVTVKSSPDLTMVVHLVSPNGRYDMTYLRNYAVLNIKDRLARLDGVGQVQLFGSGDYAMRIWLDPQKTAEHGLSAGDVVREIQAQNVEAAAGVIGASPARARDRSPALPQRGGAAHQRGAVRRLVVKTGGRTARSRGCVTSPGSSSAPPTMPSAPSSTTSRRWRSPISQSPGSNAIQISDEVRRTMAEIKKTMPEGVDYQIVYDPTQFVRASIEAVIHTLLEAIALVVLVVILFLQTWRASIIPLLAVPVSIVGTFAVMHVFGFSINALSLFGLVLAIGIVVDDAIVVARTWSATSRRGCPRARRATGHARGLGANHRHRPRAGRRLRAAGLHQRIDRPVLQAVRPDHRDLDSHLRDQLADPVPGLSALLLKDHHAPKDRLTASSIRCSGVVLPPLQPRLRGAASDGYGRSVGGVVSRKGVMMVVYLPRGRDRGLFRQIPGGFVPGQDKQYLVGFAQLPDGATLDRTEEVIRKMSEIALKEPRVESAVAFPGLSINGFTNSSNSGIVFSTLKPFEERKGRR